MHPRTPFTRPHTRAAVCAHLNNSQSLRSRPSHNNKAQPHSSVPQSTIRGTQSRTASARRVLSLSLLTAPPCRASSPHASRRRRSVVSPLVVVGRSPEVPTVVRPRPAGGARWSSSSLHLSFCPGIKDQDVQLQSSPSDAVSAPKKKQRGEGPVGFDFHRKHYFETL